MGKPAEFPKALGYGKGLRRSIAAGHRIQQSRTPAVAGVAEPRFERKPRSDSRRRLVYRDVEGDVARVIANKKNCIRDIFITL
jgi:hypothetical protein